MLKFDRAGSGIPLVFIHAFPLNRSMWDSHRPTFSKNFQYISVDLPGFGETSFQGEVLTMEQMAQHILETLDNVGIKEKAIFIGCSMGGYVTLQLLKLAPERLRGLVFVSTRATDDTERARANRFKTIQMIEKEGIEALAHQMLPSLFGESTRKMQSSLVNQVRETILKADPMGVCAALRGMALRPNLFEILPSVAVPTLVMVGVEDVAVSVEEMKAMAVIIPRSEFQMIGRAGHLLNLEQKDTFEGHLLHFLKRKIL